MDFVTIVEILPPMQQNYEQTGRQASGFQTMINAYRFKKNIPETRREFAVNRCQSITCGEIPVKYRSELHLWSAPVLQEQFTALKGLGYSHLSDLSMRVLCPLALMEFVPVCPYQIIGLNRAFEVLRFSLRQGCLCCHHCLLLFIAWGRSSPVGVGFRNRVQTPVPRIVPAESGRHMIILPGLS